MNKENNTSKKASFWKKINLWRMIKAMFIKIFRQQDSEHAIARGAVIGTIIGMIIPVGVQTVFAIGGAWILRANKITAFAFTTISNPWSMFILYPIQISFGAWILRANVSENLAISFYEACAKVEVMKWNFDPLLSFFELNGWDILLYFVVGGAVIAFFLCLIFYPSILWGIRKFKKHRLTFLKKNKKVID